MSLGGPTRPTNIARFPNGELGIVWDDGHESVYAGHPLRCACPCANCVDELSGAKLLRDETVPADVRASEIHEVGNYGISVRWSDAHDTGIYTFDRLRAMCACESCSTSEA